MYIIGKTLQVRKDYTIRINFENDLMLVYQINIRLIKLFTNKLFMS